MRFLIFENAAAPIGGETAYSNEGAMIDAIPPGSGLTLVEVPRGVASLNPALQDVTPPGSQWRSTLRIDVAPSIQARLSNAIDMPMHSQRAISHTIPEGSHPMRGAERGETPGDGFKFAVKLPTSLLKLRLLQ